METEKNWGAEEWRAPDILPTDTLLFSECGRILDKVDYRSHYFRVVKGEYAPIALLVKHGGGQERIEDHFLRRILPSLKLLDSDNRYLLMYTVYQAFTEGRREGAKQTTAHFQLAFVEGRLKKRKCKTTTKIWIEAKTNQGGIIQ